MIKKVLTHCKTLLSAAVIAVVLITPIVSSAQDNGQSHTVQTGENLFRIALHYGYTVEYLASVNGITNPSTIYVGQVLAIPNEADVLINTIQPSSENNPIVANTANAAQPNTVIDLGILPAGPATAAEPAPAPVYHTVQVGETLASIALAYGVTWTEIVNANSITDANTIYANQQLAIPGATAPGAAAVAPAVQTAPPAAPAPAVVANTGSDRTHVVQAGERLASIATIYGISWPTIARVNSITDPNTIFAGQTLVIPTTDDGQGSYIQPNTFTASSAPAPTITTGKQIIVDVSEQRIYAYENGALLRSSLVSTGLSYYPTVLGDYKVYVKYESQTMSGPGYNLPGVPYILYFYQGYGLHGTYWHSNFGTPMSHGCVNMPTPEAQWMFNWAPVGTPVHVQN